MKPQTLTDAEKAKSLLLERGWCQGPYSTIDDPICLVSALWYVTNIDHNAVAQAVEAMGFRSPRDAIQWNDAPGRTLDEVLERLDRAVGAVDG